MSYNKNIPINIFEYLMLLRFKIITRVKYAQIRQYNKARFRTYTNKKILIF